MVEIMLKLFDRMICKIFCTWTIYIYIYNRNQYCYICADVREIYTNLVSVLPIIFLYSTPKHVHGNKI